MDCFFQLFIVFLLLSHKWFRTAKKRETYFNDSFLNIFLKICFFAIIIFVQKSFDLLNRVIKSYLICRTVFKSHLSTELSKSYFIFCTAELLRVLRSVEKKIIKSHWIRWTVFQESFLNSVIKELFYSLNKVIKSYSILCTELLRVFWSVEQSYSQSLESLNICYESKVIGFVEHANQEELDSLNRVIKSSFQLNRSWSRVLG